MEKQTIDKLMEIQEWVKLKYVNSMIACNEKRTDPDEVLQELTDFFKFEILGICGCGSSDLTVKSIRDYLKILNDCTKKNDDEAWRTRREQMDETFGYDSVCDNGVLQYMAYDLDERGLTDHGSCINGAWISDLGEKCLFVFDTYLKEEYPEDGELNE